MERTLQQILNIGSLSDVDNCSTDSLRNAIYSLKAQSASAYVVYLGMSEEEHFEARSCIAHYGDYRDRAWSRLECWGSNLVAKDCTSHVRERLLQTCGEFCNHVALCANALSLFDVDWCVVCDNTGYQLSGDDGCSYRRPDACLAAKMKYYGTTPLIVMDVFTDSPTARAKSSAQHWMQNFRSIYYVISVTVQMGDSAHKEHTDDPITVPLPVVRHRIEVEFPLRCTSLVTVWSRGRTGVDAIPLLPAQANIEAEVELQQLKPHALNSDDLARANDESTHNNSTFNNLNGLADFDISDRFGREILLSEEVIDISAYPDYRDEFDFYKQLEMPEDSIGGVETRRCSTVLLSQSIPSTIASITPSPLLGLNLPRDYLLSPKVSRSMKKSRCALKGVASCATMATVASESDFARYFGEVSSSPCMIAHLEASTTLSYKFSSTGFLQRSCGDTHYSVAQWGLANLASETSCSPQSSINHALSSAFGSSSSLDIQGDGGGTGSWSKFDMAKDSIMRHAKRPNNWSPMSPDQRAHFRECPSELSFTPQRSESCQGGYLLTIPLSNISKSIHNFVSLSQRDMDKAGVVQFVVNCRRLINDDVLTGLTRDLKYRFRNQEWKGQRKLLLRQSNAECSVT